MLKNFCNTTYAINKFWCYYFFFTITSILPSTFVQAITFVALYLLYSLQFGEMNSINNKNLYSVRHKIDLSLQM